MGSIQINITADSAEELHSFIAALQGGAPAFVRPFAPQPQATPEPAPQATPEQPATPVDAEFTNEQSASHEGTEPAAEAAAVPPEPAKPAEEKRKPGRPPKAKLKEDLEESLKAEESKTNGAAAAAEAPQEEPQAAPVEEKPAPHPQAKPAEKLTRESISQAMNNYIGAFGSAAALTDFKSMCSELFGTDKLSQIPDSQDNFGKMISAIDAAIASNRFGRKAL